MSFSVDQYGTFLDSNNSTGTFTLTPWFQNTLPLSSSFILVAVWRSNVNASMSVSDAYGNTYTQAIIAANGDGVGMEIWTTPLGGLGRPGSVPFTTSVAFGALGGGQRLYASAFLIAYASTQPGTLVYDTAAQSSIGSLNTAGPVNVTSGTPHQADELFVSVASINDRSPLSFPDVAGSLDIVSSAAGPPGQVGGVAELTGSTGTSAKNAAWSWDSGASTSAAALILPFYVIPAVLSRGRTFTQAAIRRGSLR